MRRHLLRALALAAALAAAGPAWAANADHPNSNLDPKLDHGGDTGDSKVEGLNRAQTDDSVARNGPALGTQVQTHTVIEVPVPAAPPPR